MAEAAIESLPDDERASVRSETSAVRHRTTDEDSEASTVAKKKAKAPAKSTASKPKESAADRRMDSIELKMDTNFLTLVEMIKKLKPSRTGSASASAVQDNSSFRGAVDLSLLYHWKVIWTTTLA